MLFRIHLSKGAQEESTPVWPSLSLVRIKSLEFVLDSEPLEPKKYSAHLYILESTPFPRLHSLRMLNTHLTDKFREQGNRFHLSFSTKYSFYPSRVGCYPNVWMTLLKLWELNKFSKHSLQGRIHLPVTDLPPQRHGSLVIIVTAII